VRGTPESRAQARARVERALREVQEAQNRLNAACEQLSSCIGALRQWGQVGREADRCKRLWYAIAKLRESKTLDMDGMQ
jgi:hypothetical protein